MSPGTIVYSTRLVLDAPPDTRAVLLYLDPEAGTSRVLLATGDLFIGTIQEIQALFAASDEFHARPAEVGDAEDGFDDVVLDALIDGRFEVPRLCLNYRQMALLRKAG